MRQKLFSKEGLSACHYAINIVGKVCTSVMDGSVTGQVLDKLSKKATEVKKLCEVITTHRAFKTVPEKPIFLPKFTSAQFNESLSKRLAEINAFREKKELLPILCQHLQEVEING